MKKYLFVLMVFLPYYLIGQQGTDTVIAAKNVFHSILNIDSTGTILMKPAKEIGERIPHLTIFNLSTKNVDIKLSLNKKNWSNFSLEAISKNAYRCDNIQSMYIIVNPKSINPIKAKINRNKKYKIYYDYQLKIFEIRELL